MDSFTSVAVNVVLKAGNILQELSTKNIRYQMKNAHDILAEGDLTSEKIILSGITAHFPTHRILSEEAGEITQESEYLWIIDPIDGTINFSRHIEEYCISVALAKEQEIILGVIYQPTTNTLFIAEKHKGTTRNGKRITVSTETEPLRSLAALDNSSKIDKRTDSFAIAAKICADVRHLRIMGSCAMHLARVASGQLEFYFKSGFNYWDYAAGILILQEAGGTVTDFTGNPITRNSKNILASNSSIHQKALELINR